MTVSSSVIPWDLTMPAGSLQQWLFTFTIPTTGQPYPIVSGPWEYVVRATATATSTPLIDITTTANAQGVLMIDTAAATAQLTITPAATVSLLPQEYFHTLWMSPGGPSAFTWVTGSLIVQGNPQP